ncbi:hypothetical protein IGI04_037716, partial [Brassica rapa subsp. trilocularis]
FVHGRLPYATLKPDPILRNIILSLPIRNLHFATGTPVMCKPSEGAFEQVFNMTNINPHKTLFYDDSTRNIQTGKRVGLHTVWVGTSHKAEGVDIALEHIHNIREALPELWDR